VDPRVPGRAGVEEAGRGPHGLGKGAPEFWAARVKPGRVLFELDGVSVQVAREALELAAAKLPIKTRFVARVGAEG
jgi:Ribosomal protein L16/L10E